MWLSQGKEWHLHLRNDYVAHDVSMNCLVNSNLVNCIQDMEDESR